jgi:type 1 glutamine amidotransferase
MSTPTTTSPIHILVFTKTTGYRHTSIPAGVSLFQRLSKTHHPNLVITATEDSSVFTTSNLSTYTAIVLLQTLGPDLLSQSQLSAFRHWVQQGGGVVAIHGAAAGMPDDVWYEKLIGAKFLSHPDPEVGALVLDSPEANEHFILSGCGARQGWKDEWYNFHTHPRENEKLVVLLRGDTSSFQGGMHGHDHPLVWCQEFEGGRVFFTALGHFDEAYEDEWFSGMVERGLFWVARRERDLDKDVEEKTH